MFLINLQYINKMKYAYYHMLRRTLLFILLFVMFSGFAQQANTTPNKPKVGLVLSGGGAKGLAHIGVIRVLEENGITPDYITGTSMGSIVGSLYAAGYSVEDLAEINANANWVRLLTDDVLLRNVALDEKSETNKYLFEIPFKDKKINLPAGLIEGQHLEAYFSELFWPMTEHEDFDSLPIPFHCMSLDMMSNQTIEHQKGDLAKSIRASMSIPTVFSPVVMDTMILVDGGITRNFPVQEAINMGADIIIGVYVGYPEDIRPENLLSMSKLLQRATAMNGIIDAQEQFPKCDILIIPELGKLGASDFTKGEKIEQLGEKAARDKIDEIQALATKYQLTKRPVKKIHHPEKILISNIEVQGLQYQTSDYVISTSGLHIGDSVTHQEIQASINYVFGTTYFSKLTYGLKKEAQKNGYTLILKVKESERALFKIAPAYDDDLGVGIVTNFTLRNVIGSATRLLATVNIAENPAAKLSLSKSVGKRQRLSDHTYAKYFNNKLSYYEKGDRLGNYKHTYFEAGYGLRYLIGLNHQIGGGIFYKYDKLSPLSTLRNLYDEANFDNLISHDWGYHFFYRVNTLDDLYFPTKGVKLNIDFAHSFYSKATVNELEPQSTKYFVEEGDEPFAMLIIDQTWYKSITPAFCYNIELTGGFSTGETGINGNYILGGAQFGSNRQQYRNLAGYNFAELIVPNYAAIKIGLDYEISEGLHLSGTSNLVTTADYYENLFKNLPDKSFNDYILGYNVGLKYNSMLGPIQLLMADNNQDSELRFHFSIGFPF